ncbi:hypothetical protein [Desulfovibrio ferrophilus]|uniref:Uncharacterized protein n=1 Tax=Desulfovibrio ferrophilus TaxID=241368 RepID=A0A2Z6B3R5_9BACT|nr:hypothetical protein [Desulfovibrio ferrophilus]BBD10076.1 uncharacterized protein DFE_3350 [Desulfovibrio ferrophilus]
MIIVAGQWISKVEEFSGKFRNLTGLMEDGSAWLQWALLERQLVMEARSESDLLARMQRGLHCCALMTIEALDLTAHPRRMMELDDEVIKVVSQAVSSRIDEDRDKAWSELAEAGIQNFSTLKDGKDILEQLKVEDCSVFSTLSLGDLICLTALSSEDSPLSTCASPGMQHKAADFAVSLSQSCPEFSDACGFFCHHASVSKERSQSAVAEAIKHLWLRLAPLVNGTLETMTMPRVDSSEALTAQIETRVFGGEPLGFATKHQALRVLSSNIDSDCDDVEWAQAARDVLMDVRCMIRPGNAMEAVLSQDGQKRSVEYVSDEASAVLDCSTSGLVTIADFSR